MSNYPRHDLQNQLLGRQLAVLGSCVAWIIIAIGTLVALGFAIYLGLLGYGFLTTEPAIATEARRTFIALLMLAGTGIFATVTLFFYIRKHMPANIEEVEYLSKQINRR